MGGREFELTEWFLVLNTITIIIFIMQANATVLMMAIYHGLSGVTEALLRTKPDVNITATGVCLHHL